MNYKIYNEQLEVEISDFGAEIQSIKKNGLELLWHGDEKYWGRRSPVLFPIVGAVKNNKYKFNEIEYQIGQHGFLRDRQFECVETYENIITFEYISQNVDLLIYPFKFIFQLTYEIKDEQITFKYHVENVDDQEIYFSVGGHPAFLMDLELNEYSFKFPQQKVTSFEFERYINKIDHNVELSTFDYNQEKISKGTICYSDFSKSEVLLLKNNKPFIQCFYPEMEYLAIWSPENINAPFLCIEPWNGIADNNLNEVHELEKKMGIIKLEKNENYTCEFTFIFH